MKTLFVVFCLAACSAQGALVVSWRQDELTGNLRDETGLNPEATPVGTPLYGNPGVPNGTYGSIVVANAQGTSIGYGPSTTDAYFVAGSDNNNPVMNIDPGGQLTAMGWIRPAPLELATSHTSRVISTGSASGPDFGWGLGIRFTISGGVATPFVRFTAYGVVDKDSTPITVNFDQWMHIASTYDAGVTSLYLNGNFLSTHTDTRQFGNESPNNRQVIGGRLGGSNNEQANGLLDGIRVYDTVLTEEQIRLAAAESVMVIPEPTAAMLALGALPLFTRRRKQSVTVS